MRTVTRLVAAGVAAGIGFGLFCAACQASGGRGFWQPLNLVAHTAWRGAPADNRFSALALTLAVGLVCAGGVAMFLPFLALATGAGMTPWLLIPTAAVYANVVWVFGDYLLWPKLDPVAAAGFPSGVAWVGHIVAGLVAGAVTAWPRPWPQIARQIRRTRRTAANSIEQGH